MRARMLPHALSDNGALLDCCRARASEAWKRGFCACVKFAPSGLLMSINDVGIN